MDKLGTGIAGMTVKDRYGDKFKRGCLLGIMALQQARALCLEVLLLRRDAKNTKLFLKVLERVLVSVHNTRLRLKERRVSAQSLRHEWFMLSATGPRLIGTSNA